MSGKRKLLVLIVAIVGLLLFIFWPMIFGPQRPGRVFYQTPFNKTVWLQGSGGHENPRGKMAGDLIDHYLKKGMTQQEVVDLLGKPDFTPYNSFEYDLGLCSDYIDNDILVIRFDNAGKLTRGYIRGS